MDFTFSIFKELLSQILSSNYKILTFKDSLLFKENNYLILRHDVDRYPMHSLKMAKIESSMNIKSTFYFRTIPSVFKDKVIREIASLGHEIGYHYEDLTLCRGNYDKAIKNFELNINRLRKYYPVTTICMHGSPLSPWDNKNIWNQYNYKDFGVEADTSLDVDYNSTFYITDNGFGWNKKNTSVRDKVDSKFNIPIKSTSHFISLIQNKEMPDKIMLNAHPDTFFDPGIGWVANYSLIKLKNIVKWVIVKSKVFN